MTGTEDARPGDTSSPLWVVTSYYNPAGYRCRFENFRLFRRFLDAPLLVVELAGKRGFDLNQRDGDKVVQIQGEDRMWQKERLINLGVGELPEHVKYVAWVDCDVIFMAGDWAQRTIAQLEADKAVVQLFDRAFHVSQAFTEWMESQRLRPDRPSVEREAIFGESSIVPLLGEGPFLPQNLPTRGDRGFENNGGNNEMPASGMAWAARRDLFENGGLYDGAIAGAGDYFFLAGLSGTAACVSNWFSNSDAHRRHVLHWQERLQKWVGNGLGIGSIEGALVHLWHGAFENRRYLLRQSFLKTFDPERDLEMAESGAWRWADPNGQLARSLAGYFQSRKEDGER